MQVFIAISYCLLLILTLLIKNPDVGIFKYSTNNECDLNEILFYPTKVYPQVFLKPEHSTILSVSGIKSFCINWYMDA